jgi:hypothetical protein
VRVHGPFDCEQDLRRSLDLIKDDGARGQQRIGIALGLVKDADIVESEIGPRRFNRLRERGFAGLPCARQDSDGQDPKGRLEIATKPAWLNSFHIM